MKSISLSAMVCAMFGIVSAQPQPRVLILGGGVTGIIAARTLHERGIDNFIIIEARDELGGRMRSHSFGNSTIELGANWIQGTQEGDGPSNPILVLAEAHGVKTHYNDLYDSLSKCEIYFHESLISYYPSNVRRNWCG